MARPRDRLRGRNGECWQRYVAGETQEQIAEALGVSQSRVSQIIGEVRASIPAPLLEEIIAVERDRLSLLYAETMKILRAQHPLVSTTKACVVLDEYGQPLEDAGPKLAAISAAIKLSERIGRLYGLDAPQQIEATVSRAEPSPAEVEFQRHVVEQRALRALAREQAAAGQTLTGPLAIEAAAG